MKLFFGHILLIVIYSLAVLPGRSQYGYSPLIETICQEITDSSLTLIDRQLSGDTCAIISGVNDTIKTRHSNYPDNHLAAQYILEKFQFYGISSELQQYDPNGYNVVATITGSVFPDEQYIICAHYDDMPSGSIAPGADDNASGVSAVLEAARVLSQHSFDYTLKFIAFDEEEQGLIGSRAYADTALKYGEVIRGVINLDMIGWDSNNDFELSVGSDLQSMPLLQSFMDVLRIYQPVISPHLIRATNSDHSRFWDRGYRALLAIEEYPGDFLPYYHTVNDLFEYINRPFFLAVTRGAVAALAAFGKDFQIYMVHEPLNSSLNTGIRQANLVLTGTKAIDTLIYKPRLYYKIDDGNFNYISPTQVEGDIFRFFIPGHLPGTKISYYFAAQNSTGEFCVTLPESGRGVNPPGSVPPEVYFSYYVLRDTTVTICATGLPMTIPVNSTVNKSISIPTTGSVLDIDMNLSISHTYDKYLNLYLVSPTGRHVMLSTKNGIDLDHYSNTVFNDEAAVYINQGRPPYSGSYRPEQPLALFDDSASNGNWSLKIINAGGVQGSLTNLCLVMTIANHDLYVDASIPVSGNGRSWPTAFNTITEAMEMNPPAGCNVFIKPGTYYEDLKITSNGQEVVALKTGVSLSAPDTIWFPAGTDFSGLDLIGHEGEYYACVFRSTRFNNGFFQVAAVDDAGDFALVTGADFVSETGVPGETSRLSACVIRPVVYRKHSDDPQVERVIVDAGNDSEISTMLYIGNAIGDGSYDALPANFNLIDGIDLTGSLNGGGIHLQSSSFNIISNCRIYENDGPGVLVKGNEEHPSYHNILTNNEIYNNPNEAIYIGMGGELEFNNHVHFTHILSNEIYSSGQGANAILENAIDIKNFNTGSLLEGNLIHDINLASPGNGAADINSGASYTILTGNIFKNISRSNNGTYAVIMVYGSSGYVNIFNNIIYNDDYEDDGLYGLRLDATGHGNSGVIHNTIYNLDNGILLEDYGAPPSFVIENNILYVNDETYTHWGSEGGFQVSHNYYNQDPAPESWMPYFGETGKQVGEISLINPSAGDFRPSVGDDLILCNGVSQENDFLYDVLRNRRDPDIPDIGALELEQKIVWTGLEDQLWSESGNWSTNTLPSAVSNVVLRQSTYDPVLDINAEIKGLLLKDSSGLIIPDGKVLLQTGQ